MKQREGLVVRRGDLFVVDLGPTKEGNPLLRPVLVIQNDFGNCFCDTIIVVPLTLAYKAKKLFFSVLIKRGTETGLCGDYVALFSQIRTLSKGKFIPENRLGRLDDSTMERVDRAIELSLGLSTIQKLHKRHQNGQRKQITS